MPEKELNVEELFEQTDELTDKQKRIIMAAVEAFSEKGFSATSTNEIAKKAGVAEGTIFKHYKTKKELLISIVSPVMAKLVAPLVMRDLNKVLDQEFDRFEDFLRAMIENRREFAIKHLPLIKILIQEIPFHPELKELFKEHVGYKVYQRMIKVVEHYQEKGEIAELPPSTVLRLMVSSALGYLMIRYIVLPEAEWDDALETEQTVNFIMAGLSPKR